VGLPWLGGQLGLPALERVGLWFKPLFDYGWFVGFGLAFGVYALWMRASPVEAGLPVPAREVE
jgi:cytosine/uracil/thiamine/allantoin permease